MKCNAGIKWVQITYLEIIQIDLLDLFKPFKFILNIKNKVDFLVRAGNALTYFMALVSEYTLKRQKTFGFLMFLGDI